MEWAAETKRMIDEEGGTSEVIQADVTIEESCKSAVARAVELFGSVHVLINVGKSTYIGCFFYNTLNTTYRSRSWGSDGRRNKGQS